MSTVHSPALVRRAARRTVLAAGTAVALGLGVAAAVPARAGVDQHTATPIQHLVVIFQENVSFDHYFATYPVAANTDGTPFSARRGTPAVNGLNAALLAANPNTANPSRLPAGTPLTCDQDHRYGDEQKAFDGGLMDKFVQFTNVESCASPDVSKPNLVLDYYDGNTVTALWNYAQHFALSDNSFSTQFGPSTPGALNLVSGQTWGGHAVTPAGAPVNDPSVVASADANGIGSVIGDPDPAYDDCANAHNHLSMPGPTIGDLLNGHGITWGWFQGGFRPTAIAGGVATCGTTHANVGGAIVTDYSAHHEPFQYFQSTANPHHLPPASVGAIGRTDQANHQYDLSDFAAALTAGNLPAVTFLKAAQYQDGHAGYSDPINEQHFLVSTLNALQKSPYWHSTAVIIAYDDSDGWYDHVMPPILNPSRDAANDALNGSGVCGSDNHPALGASAALPGGQPDRCGYGPRQPLLVISPYARDNYVDHTVTDQTSILRFIEDNWATGRIGGGSFDALAGPLTGLFDFGQPGDRRLLLDEATGAETRD